MQTNGFLRGRGRDKLAQADLAALDAIVPEPREFAPHRMLIRRGELVQHSLFLVSGYVCRYMDDREGHRQLVAIHIPGDFIDLHSFPMKRLDHDVATLGTAMISAVRHRDLADLLRTHPHLTQMLWYSTLLDAAMHREWIFRLGRLGAEGRLAHLMCELNARLAMVGLARDGRFALPITQGDLAEACGVTNVHINRTLRILRDRSLLTFRSGEVIIHDLAALARLAEFDADYLYGEWWHDLDVSA